jgi:hypothetical protein
VQLKIQEDVFVEPASSFLFSFEVGMDLTQTITIWNEGRTRKLTLEFDHEGKFVTSTVDALSGAAVEPVDKTVEV